MVSLLFLSIDLFALRRIRAAGQLIRLSAVPIVLPASDDCVSGIARVQFEIQSKLRLDARVARDDWLRQLDDWRRSYFRFMTSSLKLVDDVLTSMSKLADVGLTTQTRARMSKSTDVDACSIGPLPLACVCEDLED